MEIFEKMKGKILSIKIRKILRKDAAPDVDCDFEAGRREDVKQYLVQKYGYNQVCYVGTYTTMKLKGALKDFGRVEGKTFQNINFITSMIPDQIKSEWDDVFHFSQIRAPLKAFVQKNPTLINNIKFIMKQPKADSIHASAVIITPKFDENGNRMEIWDWMPIRKVWDEKSRNFLLVSEWEGVYLDRAGFLKEDILGLKQLDEFKNVRKLVKKFRGEEIDLLKIPFDDMKTLKLFQNGVCEGVFQFHTSGMQSYCEFVKPDSIHDLINMNALYRPGPMRANAHKDYAKIKSGRKEPTYDWGAKEITEKTFGLYVFQEQIMKAVHIVGGLSLVESDEVRTVMKKFDDKKMMEFENKFIQGAVEKGCSEKEAKKIWQKLYNFSGYGFNLAHAAAYSMMGYWCQYLKANYPLEFWTTALQYASSDYSTTCYLSEKEKKFPNITVKPPDVNNSGLSFKADATTNTIYWSLTKIKGLGVKTALKIVNERKKGEFKSLEDFHERIGGKGIMEALVLSGSFDDLYGIDMKENSYKRRDLLKQVYDITKYKGKWNDEYDSKAAMETTHYWNILQQQIAIIGWVNFEDLIKKRSPTLVKKFMDGKELDEVRDGVTVCVAGMIDTFYSDVSKKGNKYGKINLRSNTFFIQVFVWSEALEKYQDLINKAKKEKLLIALTCNVSYDQVEKNRLLSVGNNDRIILI